jgi:hypothetical protein
MNNPNRERGVPCVCREPVVALDRLRHAHSFAVGVRGNLRVAGSLPKLRPVPRPVLPHRRHGAMTGRRRPTRRTSLSAGLGFSRDRRIAVSAVTVGDVEMLSNGPEQLLNVGLPMSRRQLMKLEVFQAV